jgi:hypothetical protein
MMNHKQLPAKIYKANNNDKNNLQKTWNEKNGSDFYYKWKDEKGEKKFKKIVYLSELAV